MRLPKLDVRNRLRRLDPRTPDTAGSAAAETNAPDSGSGRASLKTRAAHTALAATFGFAGLAGGTSGNAPSGNGQWPIGSGTTSQSAPVIPASPTYDVGGLRIIDELDGNPEPLTPEQQNAYRMLRVLLQGHAQSAAQSFDPLTQEQAAAAQAERTRQIELLLEAAFPAGSEPSARERRNLPDLDPVHVRRITAIRVEKLAQWSDSLGIPLENLAQTFATLQAPVPESDEALATAFFQELAGKQYAEVVPRDADGKPNLNPNELGVLNLLRELDPKSRAKLRKKVGYEGARRGDAKQLETQLKNEVTTLQLVQRVGELFKKYKVSLKSLAGGTDAAGAQAMLKQLAKAEKAEQKRIEAEQKARAAREAAQRRLRELEARRPAYPVDGFGINVTSSYGMRKHPVTGRYKLHTGMDLRAPYGADLNAVWGGKVVRAGNAGAYGNRVEIDHGMIDLYGNGRRVHVKTTYSHLSDIDVRAGQWVDKGDHIGDAGSTGMSTGSHLHLELYVNGKLQNAKEIFDHPG